MPHHAKALQYPAIIMLTHAAICAVVLVRIGGVGYGEGTGGLADEAGWRLGRSTVESTTMIGWLTANQIQIWIAVSVMAFWITWVFYKLLGATATLVIVGIVYEICLLLA